MNKRSGIFSAGIAIVLIYALTAGAQQVRVESDYAAVEYAAGQAMLEVYVSLSGNLPMDTEVAHATVELIPMQGSTSGREITEEAQVSLGRVGQGDEALAMISLPVAPGTYGMRVAFNFQNGEEVQVQIQDVRVHNFSNSGDASLSDITMARWSGTANPPAYASTRGPFHFVPQPDLMFGREASDLHFLIESYNVEVDEDILIKAWLADSNRDQPLQDWQWQTNLDVEGSPVTSGRFDISNLPTGTYTLHVALTGAGEGTLDSRQKRFFVYNPDVENRELAVAGGAAVSSYTAFDEVSEDEIDERLDQIRVVAGAREAGHIRSLNELDEKIEYLETFWDRHGDDLLRERNLTRITFEARVQEANDRYGTRHTEGWRSDRGRVFLRYGEPQNVEVERRDADAVPHEIWHYNNIPGERQSIFVFADRTGFGLYEMVHSTVAGERMNPNWQREIRRR